MANELDILPQPSIVEEISSADIIDRKLEIFLTAYREETGKDFTALTEDSLVVRLVRSYAEQEAKLRVAINERFRAGFVYFARDANLDLLLTDEGLIPEPGATRERKQERIILARSGSSAAGPPEWYRRKIVEVSPDEIRDVSIDFPDSSTVRIAILAKSIDGIPPDDLVNRVRNAVISDDVHPDDHFAITVSGAEPVAVNIAYEITLELGADEAVFNALEAHYRGAFAERLALGRNIPEDWTRSRLMVPGVFSVTNSGTEPPKVESWQIPYLDSLVLVLSLERQR
ncbi:MAG: baseplate J/gp47 family protein [Cohaesibacteraceae bacterium]|nr:baseplate J/gp47 family protein [Cohaesibacteraceae bacterium]MBL4876703.1 baseplate J/gp47 family protein [Cohaesibacteraceae bacterium]